MFLLLWLVRMWDGTYNYNKARSLKLQAGDVIMLYNPPAPAESGGAVIMRLLLLLVES